MRSSNIIATSLKSVRVVEGLPVVLRNEVVDAAASTPVCFDHDTIFHATSKLPHFDLSSATCGIYQFYVVGSIAFEASRC